MVEVLIGTTIIFFLIAVMSQWITHILLENEKIRAMTMVMEDGRYTRNLIAYRIKDSLGPVEIHKGGYSIKGRLGDDPNFLLEGNSMYVLMSNNMKQPLSGTSVNHSPSKVLLMTDSGVPFNESADGLISLRWQNWSRAYQNIGSFWQGQGGRSIYYVDTAVYPWYKLIHNYEIQASKNEEHVHD